MVGAGGSGFGISVPGVTVRQTAESHVPGGSGLVCSWPRGNPVVWGIAATYHAAGRAVKKWGQEV